jgi:hypothetical protein
LPLDLSGAQPSSPSDWREWIATPPLVLRIAPAVLELGLSKVINWVEANSILDAVEFYDEREAVRWRRTQELIAEYNAQHPHPRAAGGVS